MVLWKICQTLSKPKDPAWDLLAQSSLGDGVHPDRMMGFLLAREALLECCREAGHNLHISQLVLKNYSHLDVIPQFTISLSHTPEAGACVLASSQNYRSVGIDIEHDERVVKDSIAARIAHPEDEKLRNIELWCLKEAAFKALMNTGTFEKPVEFSSLKIGKKTWSHSPSGIQGEWELETIKPFVVARALVRN